MTHTFKCIDAHTCGNPVRLIVEGGPELVGNSMSEKRQHFIKEYDWIRRGLMFEPRGHDMMSGSILYPPHDPENDVAVLFLETSGCLPMCGHGTIGTITIALEEGLIKPKIPGKVKMEAPAGLVIIDYQQTGNKIDWVKLTNVPAYCAAQELTIESDRLGTLTFDVAYGGNFYAIIDPQENYTDLSEFTADQIVSFSQELRVKINKQYRNQFIHSENPTIKNVTHLLWTGKPLKETSDGRNAVFYGDKAIDRSPCGTGTSARMAQLHAKGKLRQGEPFIHESYIGSTFEGRIEEETKVGDYNAIIPSVKGWARIYGHNTITIDEDDPYAFGFSVI